uniref:glycerophosphocholine cholinephosphodiesterase ENPP6-like isoform X1 n=1 Tax=Myxine glutinosa TaxID=7769 RepID=UPI00358E2986
MTCASQWKSLRFGPDFYLGLLILCNHLPPGLSKDPHPLLLILAEGLSEMYLGEGSREKLTGLREMAMHGVLARGLMPVFPTLFYPNYYSLFTGRYSESHHVTGNYMWDEVTGKEFRFGQDEQSKLPMWWEGAEPLWVSMELQGQRVRMYHWPGCDVAVFKVQPSFCQPYSGRSSVLTQEAIADALQHFQQGSAAMAAVYYEDVALAGRHHGPGSEARRAALANLDAIVRNTTDTIRSLRLDVNLVLVSDHGLMDIDFDDKVIELENYIPAHFIKKQMDKGATVNLWTNDGREDEVYQLLKDLSNMTVYRRNEVPERFHYGAGRFVSPLTLLADEGWFITWNRAALPYWENGGDSSLAPNRGWDGYDNSVLSMQAVLLAWGPDFKQSYIAPPLHTVDVYPLLCNLTGVSPLPHNGSWEKVHLLLSSSFDIRTSTCTSWLIFWAMAIWMCMT